MSKIMELAEYYATLREDGVRRELEDEARAALAAEVEKIELLATATHIVMAERDALREKLALVEKDAARYKWLKDYCWEFKPAHYDGLPYGRHHIDLLRVDESDLDAAIDAAMGETK